MKVFCVGLVFFLAPVLAALSQKPPDSNARDFQLSVDVDLVIFNVTVTDTKGRPVKGLSKDDFRIVESGQEQTIQFVRPEDTPATVHSPAIRRMKSSS